VFELANAKLSEFHLDSYYSKISTVVLSPWKYQEQKKTAEFLSLDKVQGDAKPRTDYYDVSAPLLQQQLTVSNAGTHYQLHATTIQHQSPPQIPVPPKPKETPPVSPIEIVAQIGGCFYLLVSVWNFIVFNQISNFNYMMKLLKHVFYVKLDANEKLFPS
jgi:hypothetical protein